MLVDQIRAELLVWWLPDNVGFVGHGAAVNIATISSTLAVVAQPFKLCQHRSHLAPLPSWLSQHHPLDFQHSPAPMHGAPLL